jgi:alpha-1,2-mannosyltransferase
MMSNTTAERMKRPGYFWLIVAITVVLAFASIALSIRVIGKAPYAGEDSWFPMLRALELLHESTANRIYETLFFSGHVKFQYPPSGLLAVDLLHHLGVTTSKQLNSINSVLLMILGAVFAIFVAQLAAPLHAQVRLPIALAAYLIALQFYPNGLAFQFGQIQILLGLLVLLSCLAKLNNQSVLAGVFIAAATTVKPQLALLVIYGVSRKDWRFVGGFSAVAALALLTSVWLYGWTNHVDYLGVLTFLSQHGEYHHLNQSINGFLNRELYDGPSVDIDPQNPVPNSGFPPYIPAVYYGTVASSLLLIAVAFLGRTYSSTTTSDLLGFSLAIAAFTMASPIAWVHHYNLLLPAYAVALKTALEYCHGRRLTVALACLVTSFVLTAFAIVPPFGPTIRGLNLLQTHVYVGACILLATGLWLTYVARGIASPTLRAAAQPS